MELIQCSICRRTAEIIKIWSEDDEDAPDGRELLVYVLLLGEHDHKDEE